MRLPTDAGARAAVVLILLLAPLPARAGAVEPGQDGGPRDTDIARAIDQVKADPNLATERTVKTLRWKPSTRKPSRVIDGLRWLRGLFGWLDQSARVLIWCAVAVAAGFLVVYILRLVRERGRQPDKSEFTAPTHVRELDIRPESLPPDVGAAARALWDDGEHRAALLLLYRGLLSRLAHVHAVPIRDSSTEGDCLALAATHLTPAKTDYTGRLVRAWQRFAYAGERIQASTLHTLCDDFAAALDSPAAPDAVGARGAA